MSALDLPLVTSDGYLKSRSPVEFPILTSEQFYELVHGHKYSKCRHIWTIIALIFEFCVLLPSCPPHVPRIITKLLFRPLKYSTYSFVPTSKRGVYSLKMRQECQQLLTNDGILPEWVPKIKCYYIKPKHTERLASLYIRSCSRQPPLFVVMYCHPNMPDIACDLNMHYYFAWRLGCDFFAFDYSGYGQSSGKPSESNAYNDTMAAYDFLRNTLKVSPDKIIVFGQSLGTAVAMDLASKNVPMRGLILEGLLMSAARVVLPMVKRDICGDIFKSIDKVPVINVPTLVMHGAVDRLTTIDHAEKFFELCNTLVPPLIIPTGRHLDLNCYRAYWNRLEIFVEKELKLGKLKFGSECSPFCKRRNCDKKYHMHHHRVLYPFNTLAEDIEQVRNAKLKQAVFSKKLRNVLNEDDVDFINSHRSITSFLCANRSD